MGIVVHDITIGLALIFVGAVLIAGQGYVCGPNSPSCPFSWVVLILGILIVIAGAFHLLIAPIHLFGEILMSFRVRSYSRQYST
jgi:hypothetical protein